MHNASVLDLGKLKMKDAFMQNNIDNNKKGTNVYRLRLLIVIKKNDTRHMAQLKFIVCTPSLPLSRSRSPLFIQNSQFSV